MAIASAKGDWPVPTSSQPAAGGGNPQSAALFRDGSCNSQRSDSVTSTLRSAPRTCGGLSGAQSARASGGDLARRGDSQPGAPLTRRAARIEPADPARGGRGWEWRLRRAPASPSPPGGALRRPGGTIRVRQGLRGSQLLTPGETLTVPIGKPHSFQVEGGGARFVTEFRPPHRVGEFFRALFALSTEGRLDRRGNPRLTDLALLMQRYPEDFFYLPVIPPAVQRALGRLALRAKRRAPWADPSLLLLSLRRGTRSSPSLVHCATDESQ